MSRVVKKKQEGESPRLSFFHLGVFLMIGAAFAGMIFVGSGFYVAHWTSPAARSFARIVPIPVASVNGAKIWYDDVAELSRLLTHAGSDDAFMQAVELAIRRKEIEQLADELGVVVEEVPDVPYDESLMSDLGWSEKQYQRFVLDPLFLSQATEEALLRSSKYQSPSYQRMEGIMSNIELGIDFTDLAIQYSEGGAAAYGGDIGYVFAEQLEPGLESLMELEMDSVSEILETETYFAVGKVYDVVQAGDAPKQVGLQIISINKLPLAEVMEEYEKGQRVKIWVR